MLATDLSLDYGFAKALLLRWAADPVNTVLLTQRGHGATVARELMRGVSAGIASSSVVGSSSSSSSSGVEGASALQRVVVEVRTHSTYAHQNASSETLSMRPATYCEVKRLRASDTI